MCSSWPSSAAPRPTALAEFDARNAADGDGIKVDNQGNRAACGRLLRQPVDRVLGQLLPGDRAGVLPALVPVEPFKIRPGRWCRRCWWAT
jgi:hypothetical protein